MNIKFLFFTLTLILLLSLAGCSGLNAANEKAKNARPIVESGSGETSEHTIMEPPTLTINVGEETLMPTLGTYSWHFENEDGTGTGVESDSLSPPESVNNDNSMQVTADTEVKLNFEVQPDRYSVRIWDDENIISSSDKVVLSSRGKVIYEVLAYWEQGTASYVFSLDIE